MSTDPTDIKLVKGFIAVVAILGIIIVGSFIVFQNRSAGPPLTFTIPSGFKGPFRIVEDRSTPQQVFVDDKGIHIEIPDNGVAKFQDLSPLEKNHRVKVIDKDGKAIPYSMGDPYDGVRATPVPLPTRKEIVWFVGTYPDFKDFQDKATADSTKK